MQRRNVHASTPSRGGLDSSGAIGKNGTPNGGLRNNNHSPSRNKGHGQADSIPMIVLVGLAIVVTTLSYTLFPGDVEKDAKYVAGQVYTAEHELLDMWKKTSHSGINARVGTTLDGDDPTARMLVQDSKWVDGEKKLKEKLKILQQRQAQGKDLGVPVLTRYLGEDIPAWPSEDTMDEETWKRKVSEKYEEMRKEEEEWKEMISKLLKSP